MQRIMLKSKIHRVRVTKAELYYEGSISIDRTLLEAAGILAGEKVEVLNMNNGSRIETYAIEAKAGSGEICLNGPSARFAFPGDEVIILTYAVVNESEALSLKPKIIHVDTHNRVKN